MTERKAGPHSGKRLNQKLKPYVVLQYLLKNTDENMVSSAQDIVAYLEECGIDAERRSVYRDIKDINLIALMLEEDCTVEEAKEMLEDDEDDGLKIIVYDPHRKGFYVRQRHYDQNDIRLLAECIYAAKFVTKGQAKRLVDVVCGFVSERQAERIKHNAFLVDRIKTENKSVLNNISVINDAMSLRIDGVAHKPEKIRFKYLKYAIEDVSKQVERRCGAEYVVSPYQLLINDGNYYLLAYDRKKIRTYRVDRMKGVSFTREPREGQEEFDKIDVHTYAQRVFSMYSGKKKRVTIRFINMLLDVAVERFGTKDAQYSAVDDKHFTVTAEVEISDLFFGWLLSFGRRVKILYPSDVLEDFRAYIEKMRDMYMPEEEQS